MIVISRLPAQVSQDLFRISARLARLWLIARRVRGFGMQDRPIEPAAAAPISGQQGGGQPDGLPVPQRYLAILTIALGLTMAVLDGAIANIALPTIAHDLQVSAAASIWVVNAYQLAVTVSLLPLASAGDIIGYRRVYQVGLALFTVASLGCAMSDSLFTLTVMRVLQGFGAAGVLSVNTALIRFIYPRKLLGRGVGINAMVGSVASALGPTVASAILSVAHWPWLFAVNGPVGAIAFVIAARTLPRTRGTPHPFDTASALMSAATFGLLIMCVDGLGHGQGRATIMVELLGTLVIGAVLVQRQFSRSAPLLPVDLLRIPIFALSIATSICSFTAQGLAYVSLPFFFQDVLGRSQVETGLLMTPWPLTVACVADLAGRLSDRFSAGVLGGIGLAILSTGLALLALLPAHPTTLDIVWRTSICGLGFGFFITPNNRAMISSAPRSRSGGASGMLATARLLGQTLGAALVAVSFSLFPSYGTQLTLVLGASFAGAAAVVSCLRIGRSGP
jgi:DHA2 family multidrug resistance protein-like MFS transporter